MNDQLAPQDRTIREFVSSTFCDMQAERVHLRLYGLAFASGVRVCVATNEPIHGASPWHSAKLQSDRLSSLLSFGATMVSAHQNRC